MSGRGELPVLDVWRREIATGERVGPLILRAGPMLDGSNYAVVPRFKGERGHSVVMAPGLARLPWSVLAGDPAGRWLVAGGAAAAGLVLPLRLLRAP